MLFKLSQLQNAEMSMYLIPYGRLILVILTHPLKAHSSIFITVFGIKTISRFLQPKNAFWTITVTEDGITTTRMFMWIHLFRYGGFGGIISTPFSSFFSISKWFRLQIKFLVQRIFWIKVFYFHVKNYQQNCFFVWEK